MDTASRLRTSLCAALAAVALSTSPARAQTPGEPDPSHVRLRLGPLFVNPTMALSNVGVDTNVFNAAESGDPQSDFTMTMTPKADFWLRMGRTWVSGSVKEDVVWYKEYASERALNDSYSVAWLVPLTRTTFTVGSNWIRARERPGFEIDARSDRRERALNSSAEVRVLSKTHFGARAEWGRVEFDKDALFLGVSLRDELTRTRAGGAFTVRHQLTPLTRLGLDVVRQQDRFDFSPSRDSDSTGMGLSVELDSRALISGSSRLGFRDFKPRSQEVPGYRGITAAIDLSYVAFGSTRVAVRASRDVEYSFNLNHPYYLQTGFVTSIAQHIFGPVDIEGRVGAQRLAYRSRQGAGAPMARLTDRVRSYGGGIGYRMGRDVRLGFSVDKQSRASGIERRSYEGLRFGGAVTYAR